MPDCISCGLVARNRRSHRRGRGSIPRTGATCQATYLLPDVARVVVLDSLLARAPLDRPGREGAGSGLDKVR